jgi:DNA-binding CsgD family transcriptional regulator
MAVKTTTRKIKSILTQCELRALKLYTHFDKKEIAALLFVDYETIKSHLKNCVTKLHAKHVRHAQYMAMRMGLF